MACFIIRIEWVQYRIIASIIYNLPDTINFGAAGN